MNSGMPTGMHICLVINVSISDLKYIIIEVLTYFYMYTTLLYCFNPAFAWV